MKIFVGICLAIFFIIAAILLALVSYLMMDEVKEVRNKNRQKKNSESTDCAWK